MVAVLMQRDDGGDSDDGAQQPSPSSSMLHRRHRIAKQPTDHIFRRT